MKNKLVVILTILMVFECTLIYSQGFMPPSAGKAVVYFTYPKGYRSSHIYQFFNNEKFIGEMKGGNYLRYECEPGKQLFWTFCENHKYMEADLEPGKVYIVKVWVTEGGLSLRNFWRPVQYSEKERFEESRNMIMTMAPYIPDEQDLIKMNKKSSKVIQKNMERYKDRKDGEKAIDILSPDMAIPEEAMK
jgi:hypothetical protein